MVDEANQQLIDSLLERIDNAVAQANWETVRNFSRTVLDLDQENVSAQDSLAAAEQALDGFGTSSDPQPISPSLSSDGELEPRQYRSPALDTLAGAGEGFVGRQRELDLLKAAFDDVLLNRGRLVMLAGEAGIGKTRTAQELAAYAESRGALALWGHCHDDQGMLAYWPWVQVIRSYGFCRKFSFEAIWGMISLALSDFSYLGTTLGEPPNRLHSKICDRTPLTLCHPTATIQPSSGSVRLRSIFEQALWPTWPSETATP